MVPGGCARAALHVPRGGAGPFGARAQSSGFAPWWRPGGASRAGVASRAISGDSRYHPQRQPLSHLPNFGFLVCTSLELSDPLQGRVGNFSLPGGGHRLSPGSRELERLPPPPRAPILLATLEAVNESLWGILLNFSNQVSSDLMPPV